MILAAAAGENHGLAAEVMADKLLLDGEPGKLGERRCSIMKLAFDDDLTHEQISRKLLVPMPWSRWEADPEELCRRAAACP